MHAYLLYANNPLYVFFRLKNWILLMVYQFGEQRKRARKNFVRNKVHIPRPKRATGPKAATGTYKGE